MGNYLKTLPDGKTPLGSMASYWIGFLPDVREIPEMPAKLSDVASDRVLVACVDNGEFEAALVCDTGFDFNRVKLDKSGRPVKYFLMPREMARRMANEDLYSEGDPARSMAANIHEPAMEVNYCDLKTLSGSRPYAWARECPKCLVGTLLITRDRDNEFRISEFDRCLLCGQEVKYLDVEQMRKNDGML